MALNNALTVKILLFMLAGILFGLLFKILLAFGVEIYFINNVLSVGGNLFLSLMQLLVIPIVFVVTVNGVCSIDAFNATSKQGLQLIRWFIITTLYAAVLAIVVASIFKVGSVLSLGVANSVPFVGYAASLWEVISSIIPSNPIQAMANASMMQIVVFSILFGVVVNVSGEHGKRVAAFFSDLNAVAIKAVELFMRLVPYGIFCLMAVLFAANGMKLILAMLEYFIVVLFVLSLHVVLTLSFMLSLFKLSPKMFFKKIYSLMLFAFGASSSDVSVPIALDAVENKLGVSKSVSSLVIPFGTNINRNGTAIMQVIAALFIANIYSVPISIVGYVSLVSMVMLVSIGTAGTPGFGLITLVVVLKQMGLPIEGMALVIGVDRLLDMVRTSVNVTGNAMVACLIGKSSKQLDQKVYRSLSSGNSLS